MTYFHLLQCDNLIRLRGFRTANSSNTQSRTETLKRVIVSGLNTNLWTLGKGATERTTTTTTTAVPWESGVWHQTVERDDVAGQNVDAVGFQDNRDVGFHVLWHDHLHTHFAGSHRVVLPVVIDQRVAWR